MKTILRLGKQRIAQLTKIEIIVLATLILVIAYEFFWLTRLPTHPDSLAGAQPQTTVTIMPLPSPVATGLNPLTQPVQVKGMVSRWENISHSKDKLLFVTTADNQTAYGRVAMEESALFHKRTQATVMADKLNPTDKKKTTSEFKPRGLTMDYPNIEQLLPPQTPVILTPIISFQTRVVQTDPQNIPLLAWLIKANP